MRFTIFCDLMPCSFVRIDVLEKTATPVYRVNVTRKRWCLFPKLRAVQCFESRDTPICIPDALGTSDLYIRLVAHYRGMAYVNDDEPLSKPRTRYCASELRFSLFDIPILIT
jgi:hypothetical protein